MARVSRQHTTAPSSPPRWWSRFLDPQTTSQRLLSVLLTGFVINVVRFWPLWLKNQTFFYGDNYSLLVPGKLFSAEWLKQGEVPLWNPYLLGGISWVGDISQSLWYPSTWLFMVLPAAQALNLTIVGHLVFTMVGMYLLAWWFTRHHASALIASLLWMLAAPVTAALNNLGILQSLAWIPWIVYTALVFPNWKKRTVLLIVLLSWQLLAGYPQHLLLELPIVLILSALAEYQRLRRFVTTRAVIKQWVPWISSWLVVGVLTVGLSAVILWPFVETLLASTRTQQTVAQATAASLHPVELVKMGLPYFFDLPAWGVRWGPMWNAFPTAVPYFSGIGLVAVGWVFVNRKSTLWLRWLVGLMLLTLVLAMGSFVPGYSTILSLSPIFRFIRTPSSWLLMTQLLVALCVAMSLSQLQLSRQITRILGSIALLGLVGSLLLAGWNYFQPQSVWELANQLSRARLSSSPFHTPERDALILSMISLNMVIASAGLLVGLISLYQRRWWWLIVVVAVELLAITQGFILLAPAQIYSSAEQLAQSSLRQVVADPHYRILTRNGNQPYTDFVSYWEAVAVRAPFSDSFVDEQQLREASHLQRLRDGLTANWQTVAEVPSVNGYTTLLPTDYQQLWQETDADASVNSLPALALTNPLLAEWAVKYYVVDTWFRQTEATPSAATVVASPPPWVIYELPALSRFRLSTQPTLSLSDLQVTETPTTVTLSFTNPGGNTDLVVADRYDSGWQAEVNGQPVRVENAQGMRRVPIPAGANQVLFKYQPRSFIWGGGLSLATAVLIVAWLTWQWKGQRSQRQF